MNEPDQPCSSTKCDSDDNMERLIQSNYNVISTGSLDVDSLNDAVLVDGLADSEPTSVMLNFCQRRFLKPYVNLLGLVGLRPMTVESPEWTAYFGHIQTTIVIGLCITGYVLQYMTGFRRDRGGVTTASQSLSTSAYADLGNIYSSENGLGEKIFVYIMPSVIHLCGFIVAIYVFRVADNEQLQNLVERVFILFNMPNRLFLILWLYIICGTIWIALMTVCIVMLEMQFYDIKLIGFDNSTEHFKNWLKVLLGVSVFCHDLIQMFVLTGYAIQCYLLRCYLFILKDKLLQNTIEPLDWMREMCEFRKLLHHLNKKTSRPVCLFIILDLTYTFSGTIFLFMKYNCIDCPVKKFSLAIGNVLLWLIISLFPFFQAAALTMACHSAQTSGHQIRIRPFVHHNTSAENLNSVLLYSSSLRMSAKLFRMPIQGNYLFFLILLLCVIILTLVQQNMFNTSALSALQKIGLRPPRH